MAEELAGSRPHGPSIFESLQFKLLGAPVIVGSLHILPFPASMDAVNRAKAGKRREGFELITT